MKRHRQEAMVYEDSTSFEKYKNRQKVVVSVMMLLLSFYYWYLKHSEMTADNFTLHLTQT